MACREWGITRALFCAGCGGGSGFVSRSLALTEANGLSHDGRERGQSLTLLARAVGGPGDARLHGGLVVGATSNGRSQVTRSPLHPHALREVRTRGLIGTGRGPQPRGSTSPAREQERHQSHSRRPLKRSPPAVGRPYRGSGSSSPGTRAARGDHPRVRREQAP